MKCRHHADRDAEFVATSKEFDRQTLETNTITGMKICDQCVGRLLTRAALADNLDVTIDLL